MTPYYDDGQIAIYCGDALAVLPSLSPVDAVVTDPPYGQTSLEWDVPARDWLPLVRPLLRAHGSLWCFGSLRMFMYQAVQFVGWRLAQDIVWEKHNGSSFHADRFKRVHEQAAQFYPTDVPWERVYKGIVTTPDATARTLRRKTRPPHMGHIEAGAYASVDGGPRLMRSVIYARSCHGYAVHPTQKPLEIIRPLIENACVPGGTVLDCFMGSGSVLVAAREMGRQAIGIELNEATCEIAVRRLAQGVLPLEVPV